MLDPAVATRDRASGQLVSDSGAITGDDCRKCGGMPAVYKIGRHSDVKVRISDVDVELRHQHREQMSRV